MGIWVRTATRLEPLLKALATDLSSARSNEPLRQPLVVVGTRGMERWVLESIARQKGSIAHVDMVFPEKLMQMVLAAAATESSLQYAKAFPATANA